ncbi:alpha/beta hydrolase-fold protein [Aureispira sp. CCB-QB1]|uniref:alpha/beta hydrolase-fold protein n=1 Tax=Aureispira sp. CCB-QB1 TaxID=1313421 RepID=UPI000698D64F|nr:alpha/beta hydrolase-fold protein [Aureispira sp. CCB-QB1]
MINKVNALLILGGFIFFQQFLKAQTNQPQRFLHKVGIIDSLYSQELNESRKIHIQLPRDYDPNKNQKYPVVFILDGEIFLSTVNEVQNYYSGGFTPEMVLVGISNQSNRTRDLTPSTVKVKYGMPFRDESGKAAVFSKFIEKELIPFIEKKYPVTNFRTLIGHSYGGLFTIYTLIHQPHLFTNYLAIDPSLDWDNQQLLRESEKILATQKYKNKSLFMSLSGQLHLQNSTITIDNVLQDTTDFTLFARSNIAFSNLASKNDKNGLFFKWKFYPNDLHGTIPLPSIMDGLIAIFEWYQMESTDKINSFDTSQEELLRIIKRRAKKLQNHFGYPNPPYPEALLNMSGYMNMDMQQYEKAKMYFELAMQYYPQSANAFDSMADYYEQQGDYNNAIKYVTKALELNATNYYKQRLEKLEQKREEINNEK